MGIYYSYHCMIGAEVPDSVYNHELIQDDPDKYLNPWPDQPVYVTTSPMGGGPVIIGMDLVPPLDHYSENELHVLDIPEINFDEMIDRVADYALENFDIYIFNQN